MHGTAFKLQFTRKRHFGIANSICSLITTSDRNEQLTHWSYVCVRYACVSLDTKCLLKILLLIYSTIQ